MVSGVALAMLTPPLLTSAYVILILADEFITEYWRTPQCESRYDFKLVCLSLSVCVFGLLLTVNIVKFCDAYYGSEREARRKQ